MVYVTNIFNVRAMTVFRVRIAVSACAHSEMLGMIWLILQTWRMPVLNVLIEESVIVLRDYVNVWITLLVLRVNAWCVRETVMAMANVTA
jgi:hypothetical protein